jgi:hypothetical protein
MERKMILKQGYTLKIPSRVRMPEGIPDYASAHEFPHIGNKEHHADVLTYDNWMS